MANSFLNKFRNNDLKYFASKLTKDTSDDTLIEVVKNRCTWFANETQTMRRQWLINAAFARTQQYSILHGTEDRLLYLQEPPGRKQVTVDLIGPWKEHMIANLTTAIPRFEGVPSSLDGDAVSAARFATALLSHYWENWEFALQYITICSYLMDFGSAFVFINYKEDGTQFNSREVLDPVTGYPMLDEDGEPLIEQSVVGDIYSRVLTPHQIVCPLDSSPLNEKPWGIIRQKRPIDYYPETYGKKGEEVQPEELARWEFYDLERIANTESDHNQVSRIDYANELIYLQTPSTINPDGIVAVVANGVLLQRKKWAYKKLMHYPIQEFHLNKESGEFFARSWIERQIPIQKLYNLIWSILAENVDDTAHPKLLVANHSGVETPSDVVEVLRYNPGAQNKPEYLEPPSMPAYPINMLTELEKKMRDVQNYHGSSVGSSTPGVRSDVHAQNLQNQDLLPLSVVDTLLRTAFESMGETILAIAAEKLSEDRLIMYTGEDKRLMVQNFKGSMLADTKNVRVTMSNTWARNKAATTNTIMEAFQMGMITDPNSPPGMPMPDSTEAMRLMEFALPDGIFRRQRQHSEIAYLENEKMMRGEQVTVFPWHDYKLHTSILHDFMNSSTFTNMYDNPKEGNNEEIVGLFFQHTQQHSDLYMKALRGLAPREETQNGNQTQKETKKPNQAKKQP